MEDNNLLKEFEEIINSYSIDSELGYPDYLIADYLVSQLKLLKSVLDVKKELDKLISNDLNGIKTKDGKIITMNDFANEKSTDIVLNNLRNGIKVNL